MAKATFKIDTIKEDHTGENSNRAERDYVASQAVYTAEQLHKADSLIGSLKDVELV